MPGDLKVLLVGNYQEDTQYSMLGFGRAMLDCLPRLGVSPQFIAPRRVLPAPHKSVRKWLAYADKYILFPRSLRDAAKRADVVHLLDQGNGIYINFLQNTLHLATCHDLLAIRSALGELPYWHTGPSGRVYQRAILRGLKRSRFVACVSQATLRDARRVLMLPESRTALVRNGLYLDWTPSKDAPFLDQPPGVSLTAAMRYLLHVGNASPYKNRAGAITIFEAVRGLGGPTHLVLAGKPLSASERSKAHESVAAGSIVELSNPTSSALAWLYSNAAALLVTSYDEGFGMPIIEAQACGCPVFAPGKEPMTEVGGEGMIKIDPADPAGSALVMAEALRDVDELTRRGYNNVEKFGRDAMIEAYANLYVRLGLE